MATDKLEGKFVEVKDKAHHFEVIAFWEGAGFDTGSAKHHYNQRYNHYGIRNGVFITLSESLAKQFKVKTIEMPSTAKRSKYPTLDRFGIKPMHVARAFKFKSKFAMAQHRSAWRFEEGAEEIARLIMKKLAEEKK